MTTRWIAVSLSVACFGLTLAGCNTRPAPRSLKDEASSFRVVVDAPESHMTLAGTDSAGGTAGPESSFAAANERSSVFRTTEVAPDRIALTENLLSELNARQAADQSIVIDLPADILFDFDKAILRADAEQSLRKAAELLGSYPTAPVKVNGHTDGKGSDAYNDPLSLRRAQAVATWLKKNSGRGSTVAGLGKRRPVADNANADGSDNPDGRQRNRRVEIVIQPAAPKAATQE
ncbi:OmpA family protein [Sphingomonas sp. PP-CE-3A-406]|uniref:OmpA family protein n=1 Tax=Sphingomonas sp. PP-CE-3A-406 TaxID=2135659 RepID=UPI000F1C7155|nr:OmpA family protein [Sphingomonas sp. PP-CE-3A-406]RMB54789.1 OmpA family protein [Sphingomonas sp. PP-CE-3A-406]